MIENKIFTEDDLPALQKAANTASMAAQSWCLLLFRLELLFMIAASVSTSISFESIENKKLLAGVAVGCIILSLATTIASRLWKQEKKWYGGRALAESVKSLSWRFMTGAEPYLSKLTPQESESHFSQSLLDMLEQVRDVDMFADENYGSDKQITELMRNIRNMPLESRLEIYLEGRIRDQRTWYSHKASGNRKSSNRLLATIIVIQLTAIAAAIFLIYQPNFPINCGSILVTGATAMIAWLQMKKHQELSQSYAIAAHELGAIEEQGKYISAENELSVFVADAENAISREHTLWTARRDVFTYSTIPHQRRT